jgi:hypothetical protein
MIVASACITLAGQRALARRRTGRRDLGGDG